MVINRYKGRGATHVCALVDVLASGLGAGGRRHQPVRAGAGVGADRVAALSAAAGPRAARALVDVTARATIRAQVPALAATRVVRSVSGVTPTRM